MDVLLLEQLGSNASLHSSRDQQSKVNQNEKSKKWCALFLDDSEELEVNEEVQGDAETQLH